ncbi:hypothetical protein G7K_6054-t1 [Saitoella complicata NRRL Y-17804]|uniref:Uncharacterized protein n=1 Tax=Saitoella complicata (strain BCRC 22490 / CBS 7301 / JCM 7358 / NBRC 10748 / NRRL Y-17804) TaxID=698492 RepID=A0A0E9NQM2_SAICN|nr:hypothetical protein G7K_6054-t1 [Saitoella complicata NRRL Y-17804]
MPNAAIAQSWKRQERRTERLESADRGLPYPLSPPRSVQIPMVEWSSQRQSILPIPYRSNLQLDRWSVRKDTVARRLQESRSRQAEDQPSISDGKKGFSIAMVWMPSVFPAPDLTGVILPNPLITTDPQTHY